MRVPYARARLTIADVQDALRRRGDDDDRADNNPNHDSDDSTDDRADATHGAGEGVPCAAIEDWRDSSPDAAMSVCIWNIDTGNMIEEVSTESEAIAFVAEQATRFDGPASEHFFLEVCVGGMPLARIEDADLDARLAEAAS